MYHTACGISMPPNPSIPQSILCTPIMIMIYVQIGSCHPLLLGSCKKYVRTRPPSYKQLYDRSNLSPSTRALVARSSSRKESATLPFKHILIDTLRPLPLSKPKIIYFQLFFNQDIWASSSLTCFAFSR